jgi:23S rRNA pseudouridine1911/1915/1917 synthase
VLKDNDLSIIWNVNVIYEDDFLLVIDKPSGLVVHSDQRTEEETLTQWVEKNFPELAEVGGVHMLDMGRTEKRWGIVNRLDREVSGCVLIVKDSATFDNLAEQFRNRLVEKKYIAVVAGNLPQEVGETFEICEPIGRHRKDPRRWAIGAEARNAKRDAKTICKVLKKEKDFTVLEMQPVTGRTHQLRLHVNSLGAAILGDKKYFISEEAVQMPERILLHALSLKFEHPQTKEKFEISSTLPADFSKYL